MPADPEARVTRETVNRTDRLRAFADAAAGRQEGT